jgi:hypothetical protein
VAQLLPVLARGLACAREQPLKFFLVVVLRFVWHYRLMALKMIAYDLYLPELSAWLLEHVSHEQMLYHLSSPEGSQYDVPGSSHRWKF